jgi:hypothetical protein
MKFALSILLLSISTTSFAAQDISAFIGKYSVGANGCELLADPERVYIGKPIILGGATVLNIRGYGSESSSMEILLGAGSKQTRGTVERIHGKSTTTWTSRVSKDEIISTARTVRNNIKLDYTETTVAKITNNVLTINQTTVDNNASSNPSQSSCELIRAE